MMRRRRCSNDEESGREERLVLIEHDKRRGLIGAMFGQIWFTFVVLLALLGGMSGLHSYLSESKGFVLPASNNLTPHWQSVVADTGFMYPLVGGGENNHKWTLSSTDGVYQNILVKGEPGEIITDLINANILDEPYFDRNFLAQRQVWTGNVTQTRGRNPSLEVRTRVWVYETEFTLPNTINNNSNTFVLVVEGIKMGASLHWNGEHLGNVTNQFLRYTFQVTPKATNKLSVTFDPSIVTNGRFAGYSGGWDWAAYIPVGDERGSRYWTFGIWKHMYVVAVDHVYVSQVVPKVYYTGGHATSPMLHGAEADFDVVVQVHVVSPGRNYTTNGGLSLTLNADFAQNMFNLPLPAMTADEVTVVSFHMTVSKEDVELWWPNGMGSHRLYSLQVQLNAKTLSPAIHRRIGFRTSALVTINDTNATALQEAQEGTGSHGMYFRINGALVWARGGNFVPMDQLEGRLSDEAHRELVRSAAAANMNMLRIWGGGMVLPQSFYDACDEEGILLFHDMMFVQEHNHGAVQNPTVTEELRHLIRSLASHPSIVLWNGCNECASLLLFASFVMRVVAEEDDTRAIWPNSPSFGGWATGVRTLDGRPNGNNLTTARTRSRLETHGPYGHSYSNTFPTVNSVYGNDDTKTPPKLRTTETGPMYKNQFASEFGSSVMSSFESMSGTLSPQEWNIHGSGLPAICTRVMGHDLVCQGNNVMSQRNYACDSHIINYFGSIPYETEFGARAFQAQLYECMMGQALWMKGQFEILRSQNSFGALVSVLPHCRLVKPCDINLTVTFILTYRFGNLMRTGRQEAGARLSTALLLCRDK